MTGYRYEVKSLRRDKWVVVDEYRPLVGEQPLTRSGYARAIYKTRPNVRGREFRITEFDTTPVNHGPAEVLNQAFGK